MLYVGLDVHRRRTHVAVMDEGGHELFVRSGHPDMRYLPAERRGSPPSESAGGSHPPAALRTGRDDLPSSGPHSPASDGGRELPVGKQVGLALACLLQPGRRLEVVASEPFELLSGPADQMIIDAPCEEAQLGAIARHHASPCSGTLLSQVAYPTLPSISSRTRSAVIRRIQSTKPHLTAHLGL